MGRSLKLGRLFGIGIYVHWTFLLLPAAVLWMNLGNGLAMAVYAVGLVLAMFGCVLLHELGHALTARYYGIGTRDITLLPIGGVARLERMSEKPWEEFWIAVAGPAVNVVIAGVLSVVLLLVGVFLDIGRLGNLVTVNPEVLDWPWWEQALLSLLVTNLFLVIFNLLPAFPMDGGRVLRALLAMFLGRLPATELAAAVGRFVAAAMIIFPIFQALVAGVFNPILSLIGLFVLFAGRQELAAVRHQAYVRQAPPIDVLPLEPLFRDRLPPPEPGFSGFSWNPQAHVWIVWRNGRPVSICR
ncbi:MAG TPA: site-2 protease family protein [Gemmataceae bacterium]|nr:site-2 protease family protein [Gemmataceae bacterium]